MFRIVITATLTASAISMSAHSPTFNPPKRYYLALGDSIAFGYQAWRARAGLPPSAFNTGYVDVFADRLRRIQPLLTVVNYGCPGETTTTFLAGGCPWTSVGFPLHDVFSGSQLGAAVAFLRAHPGVVSPITLTLWGNDVREFVGSCPDPACVANGAAGAVAEIQGH